MSRTLSALGTKAGESPEHRFRSLARLQRRIADRCLIGIIRKWLKAGVMDELKHWSPSSEGTPQGGIISPLLGNIYLHFVQDLWIKKVVAAKSKGSVLFLRYADDSVVCFARKNDAEAYLRDLPARLAKFGLALAAAWERWKIPAPREIEKPWPRTAGQDRPHGL